VKAVAASSSSKLSAIIMVHPKDYLLLPR